MKKNKFLLIVITVIIAFFVSSCDDNHDIEEPIYDASPEKTSFSDYSNIPYDENIAITIRDMEKRNIDSSSYDVQIVLTKLKSNIALSNIKIYFATKTSDNEYIYEEYTTSSKNMSVTTYSSITNFTNVSSSRYEGNKFYLGKPEEYMIKVKYTIDDIQEDKTLTYKTEIIQTKLDENCTKRTIDVSNNTIDPASDPIKVITTIDKITSDTVKDKLSISVKPHISNLNTHVIASGNLTAIERADLAQLAYPELANVKVEIYVKLTKNDTNLSEYVKVYSIYGFMSRYNSLSIGIVTTDESLNMSNSDIFVHMEGNIYNGLINSFSSMYKAKYN